MKGDLSFLEDLNEYTRDLKDDPLTCDLQMCTELEIYDADTKRCKPCGDYMRAQEDGTTCGPDLCESELYKVQIDGTCEKCGDYMRG